MLSKTAEKICLAVIRWGSCLILFLPLFVYRGTLYPYIFGKIIFFRILVEIIFAAYIFLAVYDKRYRPNWKNPLIFSLTIFVAVLFLTSLFGVDFSRSFWSTQERMTGLLTILHFWVWFIVLAGVFSTKGGQDWKKLIYATLISSLLLGLYGLGQRAGFKFLLEEAAGGRMVGGRMGSILGNPIFLASYTMLHIFLAGCLILWERKKIWQSIAIISLIFNLTIMSLAFTRGVTVAFGLATFLFSIFIAFTLPSRKTKKIIIPIFILLIIFAFAGFIFLQTPRANFLYPKVPSVIVRVIYLKNLTESAEQRTVPWKIAWRGLREKPLMGWGWENYNVLFNKYFPSQFLMYGAEGTWFDRSHNQIMDILSLAGILGATAYLLFYGSIFFLLIKKLREVKNKNNYSLARDSIPLVILGLMFLAYFLQNLTVFDTPAPLIVFYFSLALVYFVTQRDASLEPEDVDQNKIRSDFIENPRQGRDNSQSVIYNSSKLPLPVLIFLVTVFLFVFVYKFNFEPFRQSQWAVRAVSLSKTELNKGLALYQKALSKPVFTNPEVRLQLARTIGEQQNNIKSNDQSFKAGLDFAISELKKNTVEHPLDARYWLYLGQLYNIGARYSEEYYRGAEGSLQQAMKLSSTRQQIYFELGKTKIFQHKYEEGLDLMKQAVALDPTIIESRHNLGIAYLATNNIEEGMKELDQSYYGKDAPSLIYIAKIFAASNDYQKAVSFSNRAVGYDPRNIEALGLCVVYYHKLGDKENKIRALDELRVVNSSDAAKLEEFLKTNP